MDNAIKNGLNAIRGDREKGASQLAEDGVRLMGEALKTAGGASGLEVLESAREVLPELVAVRPSMAPIASWAVEFYGVLKDMSTERDAAFGDELTAAAVLRTLDLKREVDRRIAEEGGRALADVRSVLTLSHSSTLERIFTKTAPEDIEIIIAESRPLCEGRTMARSVVDSGRRATIITDAQIGIFARSVDMVILGADTICADLAVVNKTGSYLAAIAAREAGKPLVVAADTYKINHRETSSDVSLEEKDGAEVWSEKAEICRNIYFETVLAGLVTGYLTEKGLLDGEGMMGEVRGRKRVEEAALAPDDV